MEDKPSIDFICHGGFAEPEPHFLRAGSLSLQYSKASLRYIRAGKEELIRMIYPAVRDRNWLTSEPAILDEKITDNGSSFSVSVKCRYRLGEIDFLSEYFIEGNEDNSIILTMRGEALASFEKNRIGFCILHPDEGCAGKICEVLHPGGTKSIKPFPDEISPHQVFRNIRAMTWPAAQGLCSLAFSGDIFETEDQRNWTDASFKTYSTPLSLPYPVRMEKGASVEQKVIFKAENIQPGTGADDHITRIVIHPGESKRLPEVGIGRSTRQSALSETEIRVLKPLKFDHYRIDIHLFSEGWENIADEAFRESVLLSYKCELALFFSDEFETETVKLICWLENLEINRISCVLVYHKDYPSTPAKLANHVIPFLRAEFPGIRTGTGTNANFAQLNRNRPVGEPATITAFSIHPREHASDNKTLVENLAAQATAVKSALRFSGERLIRVSPVTMQRRFNANKEFYEKTSDSGAFPSGADARIMSLFGAGWTAISLKYLCETDVSGITYFETAGERGIIQGEYDSRWPSEFPAIKGMVFPVCFIFKFFLKYKNYKIIRSESSCPLVSDALVLSDGKKLKMIIINFTGKEQKIVISGCRGWLKSVTLDAGRTLKTAMDHRWDPEEERTRHPADRPFTLLPWSVTFAEGEMAKDENH